MSVKTAATIKAEIRRLDMLIGLRRVEEKPFDDVLMTKNALLFCLGEGRHRSYMLASWKERDFIKEFSRGR